MESGNINKYVQALMNDKEFMDKLYNSEFYKKDIVQQVKDFSDRLVLGIPEVYHIDSEGNQRLLSIEETLEFLDKTV